MFDCEDSDSQRTGTSKRARKLLALEAALGLTQAKAMAARGIAVAERLLYVVDDERLIADVVQQIFQMEGFKVQVFSNPLEALKTFNEASQKPDVLLTDYVMKPLNGMELMQKCRTLHPSLLTVLFSGNVTEKITELYAEKPDAFVAKPFQPSVLVRIVRQLIENPS
jgi:DNA-binding NtrC family response regulator